MAVVSQSIPNFLNGISQQTPTQRGINQGEEQINCQNNIIKGLGKRPPSEYIATLDATNVFPNTTKIWSIQRDENNKYMATGQRPALGSRSATTDCSHTVHFGFPSGWNDFSPPAVP